MQHKAKSTFEVKAWDEKTVSEVDGRLKITRASVAFAYSGDLTGASAMEYVMAYGCDESATVIGLERITGQLGGKSGSFVLESHGGYAAGVATGNVTIIPGSGTGDLTGIAGHGQATSTKDGKTAFELEYELR